MEKPLTINQLSRLRNNETIAKRICDSFPREEGLKIFIPIGVGHLFNYTIVGDCALNNYFGEGKIANILCYTDENVRISSAVNQSDIEKCSSQPPSLRKNNVTIDRLVSCPNTGPLQQEVSAAPPLPSLKNRNVMFPPTPPASVSKVTKDTEQPPPQKDSCSIM